MGGKKRKGSKRDSQTFRLLLRFVEDKEIEIKHKHKQAGTIKEGVGAGKREV